MSIRQAFLSVLPLFAVACTALPESESVADHHEDGTEAVGTTTSALTGSDTVSVAVTSSCTTAAVKGLAQQLVDEIQCLQPGSLAPIDNLPGVTLGSAVFPWLQTPARDALVAAQKERGVAITINSGLRTLPQQFLLYRWYQTGRCGIGLAAKPGTSNHESGIAVDVSDNSSWRSAMSSESFAWLGSSDPVHFDFKGSGTINMKGYSVLAFQRLWNRNHPTDKIAEDGVYGPEVESRLSQSPTGGFPIGAKCDPGTKTTPVLNQPADDGTTVDSVPDADEPSDGTAAAAPTTDPPPSVPAPGAATTPSARHGSASEGCSMASGTSSPAGAGAFALGLVAAGLVARRRRR